MGVGDSRGRDESSANHTEDRCREGQQYGPDDHQGAQRSSARFTIDHDYAAAKHDAGNDNGSPGNQDRLQATREPMVRQRQLNGRAFRDD